MLTPLGNNTVNRLDIGLEIQVKFIMSATVGAASAGIRLKMFEDCDMQSVTSHVHDVCYASG